MERLDLAPSQRPTPALIPLPMPDGGTSVFAFVESPIMAPALAAIPEGARVVFNIDADGLDPALCPGVLSPAFGGIGYHQMLDLFEGVAARGTIVGATLVEYVAEQDPAGLAPHAVPEVARHPCGVHVPHSIRVPASHSQ